MATVSKEFADNFARWAAMKVESGDFTPDEITELKAMIRKDLEPGPDQLRQGMTVINAAGVKVPATIDDHNERAGLWESFFAEAV